MSGPGYDCPRTRGLIRRLVQGSAIGEEERRHAETCRSCGPVIARAQRFDAELERTARGLVTEELPRGILDPEVTRQVGGSPSLLERGIAGSALAAMATALVVALALRPGVLPPGAPGTAATPGTPEPLTQAEPTPTPVVLPMRPAIPPLHSTGELIVWLVGEMSFECVAGEPLPTEGPDAGPVVRHSAVCSALDDRRRYSMNYALGVSQSGEIAGVEIKADINGRDTPQARAAVAIGMANLTALAFKRDVDAIAGFDFVFAKVPKLEAPTEPLEIVVNTVRLSIERLPAGTYVVELALSD